MVSLYKVALYFNFYINNSLELFNTILYNKVISQRKMSYCNFLYITVKISNKKNCRA